MIGLRLPKKLLKKIGAIADARSTNRSGAVRWLLEQGVKSGLAILLLRQGSSNRKADRIALAYGAEMKATAAREAANRNPTDEAAATKALRKRRTAIDQQRAISDPQYARLNRRPKGSKGSPRSLSASEIEAAENWTAAKLDKLARGSRPPR